MEGLERLMEGGGHEDCSMLFTVHVAANNEETACSY